VGAVVVEELKESVGEARERRFPGEERRFGMADDEIAALQRCRSRKR